MIKQLLMILSCIFLFSCKVSYFNVDQLKAKYEHKMNNRKSDKIKDINSGNKLTVKRSELFNKTPIYFNETEITRPFKVIYIAQWNPINLRVLVPPFGILTLFTKRHIINQALRRAALTTASAGGDAVVITNNPTAYQVITYTDGKGKENINSSMIVTKSDLKKAKKDKAAKEKAEKKKHK